MLLSFQQDLNLTESELKRANDENRRLREETTLTPDKSILDSKEKQIKKLGEKIRTLEKDYDEALNSKDEQKMKADIPSMCVTQKMFIFDPANCHLKNTFLVGKV